MNGEYLMKQIAIIPDCRQS